MTTPFIANPSKLFFIKQLLLYSLWKHAVKFLWGINFYCQSVVEIIVIDSNFNLPRFFRIGSSYACPSYLSTWFSSAQSSFILKFLVHFCKKILKAHAFLQDPKCRRPRIFWRKNLGFHWRKILHFNFIFSIFPIFPLVLLFIS